MRAYLQSSVPLAFQTLREHKLRSFLTVLGIIIGTSTVIAVSAIVVGFDSTVTGFVKEFGGNTAMVFKFQFGFRFNNLTKEERTRKPLTLNDARAISERCPTVEAVSPYLFPPWNTIHRIKYKGDDIYRIDMGGTEAGYASGGTVMKMGRFFSDVENLHHMPVVVIGEDIQRAWFPFVDPIGKWVEVDGHSLQIVGVMQRPSSSFANQEDRRVLLPYFTMRKMFPNAQEHMLVVIAQPGKLPQAIDEVRTVLRIQRRVPFDKPDNFYINTAEQMIADFRRITAMVAIVTVVLSSIGLLVGGIGVMNIMLVSVTERTREIGVRKAIGARRGDITVQFLIEAVTLTLIGGVLGILFGWAIAVAVRLIFPSLPTLVPLWAVALGVVVSAAVGLFFGIWPASKAARLDPVVALRYE
ncbi:MAG: ABC transporter permease [Acidobacteria bacterium]|nr:ABC transporter permease [Acidobacteriota bacterium]